MLGFEIRGLRLSGSFLSIVLAMALLGPAPAAALGVGCALVDACVSRRSLDRALVNIATYATFPLVGGLAIEWLVGDSTCTAATRCGSRPSCCSCSWPPTRSTSLMIAAATCVRATACRCARSLPRRS